MTDVEIGWRQPFTSSEANRLHAEAFDTARVFSDEEWDWVELVQEHSLGWVTARHGSDLVGFANVLTDGFVHAWLQDVMVSPEHQRGGIGAKLVEEATKRSRQAGCEWLHVDFDDDVADFYYRRCGFQRTNGGLVDLQEVQTVAVTGDSRLVTVVLVVSDLDRSADLYSSAFGLDLHIDDHDGDDPWTSGRHAATSWTAGEFIHFALSETKDGRHTTGGQVAFRVPDIDRAHRRAEEAGAEVVHAPTDQPWGRSARYRDPDGNIIELTQPR